MSKVVCVKVAELRKFGYNNLEDWLKDPTHVYIGRGLSVYVKGADKSKWANPFSAKKWGRGTCLVMYKEYIKNHPQLMTELIELDGKVLGCWCAPLPCHGTILIELLKEHNKNIADIVIKNDKDKPVV